MILMWCFLAVPLFVAAWILCALFPTHECRECGYRGWGKECPNCGAWGTWYRKL
jgi:hypothetical protein